MREKSLIDSAFKQFWDTWYGKYRGSMPVDAVAVLIEDCKNAVQAKVIAFKSGDTHCSDCPCRHGQHLKPDIKIGKFTLSRHPYNGIWISKEDGEGGQFTENLIEAAIAEFYAENF